MITKTIYVLEARTQNDEDWHICGAFSSKEKCDAWAETICDAFRSSEGRYPIGVQGLGGLTSWLTSIPVEFSTWRLQPGDMHWQLVDHHENVLVPPEITRPEDDPATAALRLANACLEADEAIEEFAVWWRALVHDAQVDERDGGNNWARMEFRHWNQMDPMFLQQALIDPMTEAKAAYKRSLETGGASDEAGSA